MTLTHHAKQRMSQRIITFQDIYNTVKCGTLEPQAEGKTKYILDSIYVILDGNNNVVTCCFTRQYDKYIHKFAKSNKIGYYAAVRQLRRESIVSTI